MYEKQKEYSIWIIASGNMDSDILSFMLGSDYRFRVFHSGRQAVKGLQGNSELPDLLFLDMKLSDLEGLDVLVYLNRFQMIQKLPVIFYGMELSEQCMNRAFSLGAADYLPWPWHAVLVRKKAEALLLQYGRQQYLEHTVLQQFKQKNSQDRTMIQILSHIVATRNGESGDHVNHISLLTELLLRELSHRTLKYGLTSRRIALISTAAALHDIGKIVIPEKILNKPGRLTPKEFDCMKAHTLEGARILESTGMVESDELVHTAWEICRWHHERIDGAGYPDGLRGDEIPITAQVVALADVYDALTSERCYKKAFSPSQAMDMILRGECGQFVPLLIDCLKVVKGQETGYGETGKLMG